MSITEFSEDSTEQTLTDDERFENAVPSRQVAVDREDTIEAFDLGEVDL